MRLGALFFILCIAQAFAVEGNDDGDLKSLLNEANSALETPAPAPKEKVRPAHHKAKKKEAEAEEGSEAPQKTASEPKPLPPARLVPIDSPDLNEILSVDLNAKRREQENIYPKSVIRLTGGLNWLGLGHGLVQDDDTFTNIDGGALTGFYLQYNPAWALPFFNNSVTNTSLSLAFGTGYFRGQALMRRTGVQTGDQKYDLSTFPIDVEFGPVLSLWRRVGIQFAYGLGAEFVHQSGDSQWNTVTNMFWGDTISAGLRGYISSTIEAYLGWKYRGLLLGSTPRVHESMLTAGVGFEFAD